MIRFVSHSSAEYIKDYENGWKTSQRGSEGALDRADARNVSHAWYDGYADYAASREKWHLRWCPDHDNCP